MRWPRTGNGFANPAVELRADGADAAYDVALLLASDTGNTAADLASNHAACIAKGSALCAFAPDNALTDSSGTCSCHSIRGTMENAECSNRGICDLSVGTCTCFTGYGTSDGNGDPGLRGDCGWKIGHSQVAAHRVTAE